MIKPHNRKKKKPTEYFYYSDSSEYYKEKLKTKPNRDPQEEGNEIISIDGIIVGPKNKIKTQQLNPKKYPEDLETQASIRRPSVPSRPPGQTPAGQSTKTPSAVVYSFKNPYGQREHVGVIFDESSRPGPQVSKVLPSNKNHILNHQSTSRHDRGHSYDPIVPQQNPYFEASTNENQQTLANFIPLEKKAPELGVKKEEQSFPLGNPFLAPLLKARPEYFPPLQYPPLFKTRPHKLEGSFGPALPPKPEPDVILFQDEVLPGVVREVDDYRQTQQERAQRREDVYYSPYEQSE